MKNVKRSKNDLEVITFQIKSPNWTFVLLIVFFGVAIGQALLLFRLSDQVKAQDVTTTTTINAPATTPSKQINDLPDMVGGC